MTNTFLVQGGLGNQLFILLEALRCQRKYSSPVLLNTTDYRIRGRGDRPYELKYAFPDICNYIEEDESPRAYFDYISTKIFTYVKKRIGDGEQSPSYSGESLKCCGRLIHNGYYQYLNESSLDSDCLMKIRSLYNNSFESNSSYQNKLAVHIRRGDYLLPKHGIHGLIQIQDIINETYYAMNAYEFDGITIFTDSPSVVDQTLFHEFSSDVTIDPGGVSYNVLSRMANHSGIIASNSTFSFWAGMLGNPEFFSIPSYWMSGVDSSCLGASWIRRYKCTL